MGVHTNPDISATCTVTADGGILPLYFIYPESQVKHATGNTVKQQKAHAVSKTSVPISTTGNCNTISNNGNVNNSTTNNITNNIHIHIPDIDKHGNFYTTTHV